MISANPGPSPWGGNAYAGGDGTQLPINPIYGGGFSDGMTKEFTFNGPPAISPYNYGPRKSISPVYAAVSLDGTGHNDFQYLQEGPPGKTGATLDSADRSMPAGANGLNDSDMFQDFVYAAGNGTNIQGTNYLNFILYGLTPGAQYQVAIYSYDSSGNHTTNWTATQPRLSGDLYGWWAPTPSGNNIFTAPADEQSIVGTPSIVPAPAVFTLTADSSGFVALYGFGGDGISGDQAADTTYINGFQISQIVPEPGVVSLLGIFLPWILRRRRLRRPS